MWRRDQDEGQAGDRIIQVRLDITDELFAVLDRADIISDVLRLKAGQRRNDVHQFSRLGIHRLPLGGRFGHQHQARIQLGESELMPNEFLAVYSTIKSIGLAGRSDGALRHKLTLIRPGQDECADIIEGGGTKNHADDLARGGGEGWVSAHDELYRAQEAPKFIGRKSATT